MTSTEAMIYQLKNLKGKPLKQKLEHIITYFWLPILVTLAILVAMVSYIVHLATAKDMGLNVICLNARTNAEQTEIFIDEFARYADIDTGEYDLYLSSDLTLSDANPTLSYETYQVIVAQAAAKYLDLMAGDLDTMMSYFYQDFFGDLTQQLTPRQQELYAPYFLYADMAVVRQIADAVDGMPELPDPQKPEAMAEPVPVALLIPEGSRLLEIYYPNTTGPVCAGIPGNTENLEHVLAFIDYIME